MVWEVSHNMANNKIIKGGESIDINVDENGKQYVNLNLTDGLQYFTEFDGNGGGGGEYVYGIPTIGSGKRADAIRALGFSEHPSESECSRAMTTIKVPSRSKGTLNLTIHKNLAEDVKAIFKEIYDSGFDAYMVGGYCYRQINNPNNKSSSRPLSMHSFGCAIDINWDVNPFVSKGRPMTTGDTDKVFRTPNSPVVQAMARHGFGWGGRYGDYMHFSTANGG